jgi:hypothetical protein
MKIDYSKMDFTQDEKNSMKKETERLYESNKTHIPVLILIKSNVLKMDKQKYLISEEIHFNDFINNTLKKKLHHFHNNDTLEISAVKLSGLGPEKFTKLEPTSIDLKTLYSQYSDPETGLLILKISRNTTYKYAKNTLAYYLGY